MVSMETFIENENRTYWVFNLIMNILELKFYN